MDIGIVGNGVVGRATGDAYAASGHEVKRWDTNPDRKTHDLHEVVSCQVVFLCLPTPANADGSCDVSAVDQMLDIIEEYIITGSTGTLVVKSTVPVGYTGCRQAIHPRLKLCHSPEFLTARTCHSDARHPRVNIVGYPGGWDNWDHPWVLHPLVKLYSEQFRGVRTIALSSDESEAVKLFTNSFFAIKVAAFNELRAFADKTGLDWLKVRDAMLADQRIHPLHTQVPGPDGKRGFGGFCFPKDLASMVVQAQEEKTVREVLMAAQRTNDLVREKD